MSTTFIKAPEHSPEVSAPDLSSTPRRPSRCEECGYDLRASAPGRPCPECGHLDTGTRALLRPDQAWERTVAMGLALLLGVTLYATSSVLVQPFSDDLGGTLPALNVPGPKLWAIPLLQRPIGRNPQWPGVVGTRAALLSLLAVWLITTPHPEESLESGRIGQSPRPVRQMARWGAVLPFGVAFGILLTTQGLWPAELPSYRMLLVACVELPAAALLYAHLCNLAGRSPGRDRRRAFELLRWAVPATIVAGVLLMGVGWLFARAQGTYRAPSDVNGPRLLVFAAYGAAAVSCGMVATAAVGSLAASYAGSALQWRPAALSRLREAGRRAFGFASGHQGRLHYAAVASGLLLLLVVTVLATDEAPWSATREYPSGNLPFYGFPGPRLVAATPFLGRRSNWDPLVSCMTLVALNLAAVWLITLRPSGAPRDRLRPLSRWASVFATGAALATATAWESMEGHGGRFLRSGLRPEFFALATVLCQVPPTILLYACLARIAVSEANAPALARRFIRLTIGIPALVAASFLVFLGFRKVRFDSAAPALLAFSGVAGAVQLVVAVWAAAAVAALAATLVRARVLRAGAPGAATVLYRNVGGAVETGDAI